MVKNKIIVLVVEDHAGILKLLTLELKLNGYEVISAHDGLEAISMMKSGTPDILLLDLHLPVINGLEVLRQVRKKSLIPVIVISAHTEMGQKALELGADSFIAKPFDPDRVVKEIQQLLKQ
jgi:DNA-binding response OmpR family regulator